MIFAYSILRGYTALRGTMVIHLPMLIAMLVFVEVPSTNCANEQKCFMRGPYWYQLAIFLHTTLALLHVLMLIENKYKIIKQELYVYIESAKIFAIPLQVLNFIF